MYLLFFQQYSHKAKFISYYFFLLYFHTYGFKNVLGLSDHELDCHRLSLIRVNVFSTVFKYVNRKTTNNLHLIIFIGMYVLLR
jgi:hypothetical protein